jgi:chromosome segregation ATPase
MNFYDLFEFKDTKGEYTKKKDSEEHQDITIADPKAALALKQARNKYSYANTDVEALLKMQQDDQEQEEKDIDKLEREFDQHEKMIAKNRETVAKLRKQDQEAQQMIAQQEEQLATLKAMTLDQETELTKLRATEKDFETMVGQYNDWAAAMKAEIDAMQAGLSGVQTPQGEYRPNSKAPEAPTRRRSPPDGTQTPTVLSRRFSSNSSNTD